jgi:hypothetical protein
VDALAKLLDLFGTSMKSLRWSSLAAAGVAAYLRYCPESWQPFVSQSFLKTGDRYQWLGLILVVAAFVFLLGWCAAGIDSLLAIRQKSILKSAGHEASREASAAERKKRRAQRRLVRVQQERVMRSLSPGQISMIKAFLKQPNGIAKINNDAQLDVATLLTAKGVLLRMRPWYDNHGRVVGEVFVLNDWVRDLVPGARHGGT